MLHPFLALLLPFLGAAPVPDAQLCPAGVAALERHDLDASRAAWAACCDGGAFAACDTAGKLFLKGAEVVAGPLAKRAGDVPAKDAAKARTYWQKGCDGGHLESCGDLGNIYSRGLGVPADDAKAAGIWGPACKRGSHQNCYNLAVLLAAGRGGKADPERAVALNRVGCAAGHATSCVSLGGATLNGTGGIRADRLASEALFAKACELGEPAGCYNTSSLALDRKDPVAAVPRLARGCALGMTKACERAYALVRSGELGTHTALLIDRLATACKAGSGDACDIAGTLLGSGDGVPADAVRAKDLLEKGCHLGTGMACNNLALLYERDLVAIDPGMSAPMIDAGPCPPNAEKGCKRAVIVTTVRGRALALAIAATFYRRACDLGTGFGCLSLGNLVHDGRGVTRDLEDARDLYGEACTADVPQACDNLGIMLWNGEGTAKDPARARELVGRGCRLGLAAACTHLEAMR